MKKGLESFENIIREGDFRYLSSLYDRDDLNEDIKRVVKELKALDIIKNKSVNTRNLLIYCFEMKDTYKNYVEMFNYCDNYWELGKELLIREEYDLLKEVLLDNYGKT